MTRLKGNYSVQTISRLSKGPYQEHTVHHCHGQSRFRYTRVPGRVSIGWPATTSTRTTCTFKSYIVIQPESSNCRRRIDARVHQDTYQGYQDAPKPLAVALKVWARLGTPHILQCLNLQCVAMLRALDRPSPPCCSHAPQYGLLGSILRWGLVNEVGKNPCNRGIPQLGSAFLGTKTPRKHPQVSQSPAIKERSHPEAEIRPRLATRVYR
jgi:hypothetical protein